MNTTLRLAPLLLLALVAAVLAGCGSESSSRNAAGAWTAANDAAQSFAANGPKYALALQDCTNTAKGNTAQAACAKEALAKVAADWAPVGAALGILDKLGSSECQAAVGTAIDGASLLDGKDAASPTTEQAAEALPAEISNAIQQLSQDLTGAKAACA